MDPIFDLSNGKIGMDLGGGMIMDQDGKMMMDMGGGMAVDTDGNAHLISHTGTDEKKNFE
jgi:hypothetical protein